MWSFCRSVCHAVNRITDERGNGRRPNLAWRDGHRQGVTLKWVTFSTDPYPCTCGFRITFSFSWSLRNRGFFDICQHFSYNQRPTCTILGEMTDTDKIMHPQYFGMGRSDRHPDSDSSQKSGFQSQVTFGWNFGVGGGLHSLSVLVFYTSNFRVNSSLFGPSDVRYKAYLLDTEWRHDM